MRYVVAVAVVLTLIFSVSLRSQPKAGCISAQMPSGSVCLEVAQTTEDRQKGLSGRANLKSGHGMLFVFDTPDTHGIWMKDMKFPIDIVWLDESKRVVSIEKSVSPDSYPEIFKPTEPSLYVIELNSGASHGYGIGIGSRIDFALNN